MPPRQTRDTDSESLPELESQADSEAVSDLTSDDGFDVSNWISSWRARPQDAQGSGGDRLSEQLGSMHGRDAEHSGFVTPPPSSSSRFTGPATSSNSSSRRQPPIPAGRSHAPIWQVHEPDSLTDLDPHDPNLQTRYSGPQTPAFTMRPGGFPVVVMESDLQQSSSMSGMPMSFMSGMGGDGDLPPHLMEEEPLFLDSSSGHRRNRGRQQAFQVSPLSPPRNPPSVFPNPADDPNLQGHLDSLLSELFEGTTTGLAAMREAPPPRRQPMGARGPEQRTADSISSSLTQAWADLRDVWAEQERQLSDEREVLRDLGLRDLTTLSITRQGPVHPSGQPFSSHAGEASEPGRPSPSRLEAIWLASGQAAGGAPSSAGPESAGASLRGRGSVSGSVPGSVAPRSVEGRPAEAAGAAAAGVETRPPRLMARRARRSGSQDAMGIGSEIITPAAAFGVLAAGDTTPAAAAAALTALAMPQMPTSLPHRAGASQAGTAVGQTGAAAPAAGPADVGHRAFAAALEPWGLPSSVVAAPPLRLPLRAAATSGSSSGAAATPGCARAGGALPAGAQAAAAAMSGTAGSSSRRGVVTPGGHERGASTGVEGPLHSIPVPVPVPAPSLSSIAAAAAAQASAAMPGRSGSARGAVGAASVGGTGTAVGTDGSARSIPIPVPIPVPVAPAAASSTIAPFPSGLGVAALPMRATSASAALPASTGGGAAGVAAAAATATGGTGGVAAAATAAGGSSGVAAAGGAGGRTSSAPYLASFNPFPEGVVLSDESDDASDMEEQRMTTVEAAAERIAASIPMGASAAVGSGRGGVGVAPGNARADATTGGQAQQGGIAAAGQPVQFLPGFFRTRFRSGPEPEPSEEDDEEYEQWELGEEGVAGNGEGILPYWFEALPRAPEPPVLPAAAVASTGVGGPARRDAAAAAAARRQVCQQQYNRGFYDGLRGAFGRSSLGTTSGEGGQGPRSSAYQGEIHHPSFATSIAASLAAQASAAAAAEPPVRVEASGIWSGGCSRGAGGGQQAGRSRHQQHQSQQQQEQQVGGQALPLFGFCGGPVSSSGSHVLGSEVRALATTEGRVHESAEGGAAAGPRLTPRRRQQQRQQQRPCLGAAAIGPAARGEGLGGSDLPPRRQQQQQQGQQQRQQQQLSQPVTAAEAARMNSFASTGVDSSRSSQPGPSMSTSATAATAAGSTGGAAAVVSGNQAAGPSSSSSTRGQFVLRDRDDASWGVLGALGAIADSEVLVLSDPCSEDFDWDYATDGEEVYDAIGAENPRDNKRPRLQAGEAAAASGGEAQQQAPGTAGATAGAAAGGTAAAPAPAGQGTSVEGDPTGNTAEVGAAGSGMMQTAALQGLRPLFPVGSSSSYSSWTAQPTAAAPAPAAEPTAAAPAPAAEPALRAAAPAPAPFGAASGEADAGAAGADQGGDTDADSEGLPPLVDGSFNHPLQRLLRTAGGPIEGLEGMEGGNSHPLYDIALGTTSEMLRAAAEPALTGHAVASAPTAAAGSGATADGAVADASSGVPPVLTDARDSESGDSRDEAGVGEAAAAAGTGGSAALGAARGGEVDYLPPLVCLYSDSEADSGDEDTDWEVEGEDEGEDGEEEEESDGSDRIPSLTLDSEDSDENLSKGEDWPDSDYSVPELMGTEAAENTETGQQAATAVAGPAAGWNAAPAAGVGQRGREAAGDSGDSDTMPDLVESCESESFSGSSDSGSDCSIPPLETQEDSDECGCEEEEDSELALPELDTLSDSDDHDVEEWVTASEDGQSEGIPVLESSRESGDDEEEESHLGLNALPGHGGSGAGHSRGGGNRDSRNGVQGRDAAPSSNGGQYWGSGAGRSTGGSSSSTQGQSRSPHLTLHRSNQGLRWSGSGAGRSSGGGSSSSSWRGSPGRSRYSSQAGGVGGSGAAGGVPFSRRRSDAMVHTGPSLLEGSVGSGASAGGSASGGAAAGFGSSGYYSQGPGPALENPFHAWVAANNAELQQRHQRLEEVSRELLEGPWQQQLQMHSAFDALVGVDSDVQQQVEELSQHAQEQFHHQVQQLQQTQQRSLDLLVQQHQQLVRVQQQQQQQLHQGRGLSRLVASSTTTAAGAAAAARSVCIGSNSAVVVPRGLRQLLRNRGYLKQLLEGLGGVDPEAECVKGAMRELLYQEPVAVD